MIQDGLNDVLDRRLKRAIAAILGVKEREERDPANRVSLDSSNKVRKVILDQLNDFCDLAKDLLGSVCDANHVVLNEHYLERLEMSLSRFDALLEDAQQKVA